MQLEFMQRSQLLYTSQYMRLQIVFTKMPSIGRMTESDKLLPIVWCWLLITNSKTKGLMEESAN